MTTKTIVADTMQQAMLEAKRELGEAAIMLHSRSVGDHFEVTVTDDAGCLVAPKETRRTMPEQQTDTSAFSSAQEPKQPKLTPSVQIPAVAESAALPPQPVQQSQRSRNAENGKTRTEPAFQKLLGELRSIGDSWENIGGRVEQFSDRHFNPGRQELRGRLDRLHLEKKFQQELLQVFREIADVDRAWQMAITQVQDRLHCSSVDVIANGGAYVFVGPSGAGKTATIAKLAAEYVLVHGADSVALLTTDTFRIGACEQLLKLGQVLGIEVFVVDSPRSSIGSALTQLSGKTTVLVDSAGLGSNDADLAGQLADIQRQGERLNSLLVLPANMQYASMQAAYENYRVQPYAGCVFTKLDECNSLGAVVSLALETDLPLTYVTRGHAIPDALSRVDPLCMVEYLLSFAGRDHCAARVRQESPSDLSIQFAQQLQLQL